MVFRQRKSGYDFYRPQTKLRKGNVFTSAPDRLDRQPSQADTPTGQTRQTPLPWTD